MLSVVVPVFNEKETIIGLHARIVVALKTLGLPFEIIFVDDGSNDNSIEVTKELSPLQYISLQRNYGQTAAIDTGIRFAKGDIIILIDADLQNDPAEIPRLLAKLDEGYDAVLGFRVGRKDTLIRISFSRLANFCSRLLLGVRVRDFGCGLKAFRSAFVKDFRLWGESQVFLVAVAKERGARIAEVPVTFHPRKSGVSKIHPSKMLKGAFDLLSIVFFVRYFSRPLRFFGGWGAFFLLVSATAFSSAIILRLGGYLHFTETPLPTIGTLLALLGVLLFMMGLLAEVMLRIYYDKEDRSPYTIKNIYKNGQK